MLLSNPGNIQDVLDMVGFPFESKDEPASFSRNGAFKKSFKHGGFYGFHQRPHDTVILRMYIMAQNDSKAAEMRSAR
jgi:hypothetical protein